MKWPWVKPGQRVGKSIRGKVHRISIVQNGELSLVLRFGMEEMEEAKRFVSGTPVDVFELVPPPKDAKP